MSDAPEVPLDTLVGALDIVGRLKSIERSIRALSDNIANLQIMVTAMEIARVAESVPPLAPNPYLPGIYTYPHC